LLLLALFPVTPVQIAGKLERGREGGRGREGEEGVQRTTSSEATDSLGRWKGPRLTDSEKQGVGRSRKKR
jgi:hypothetical protein